MIREGLQGMIELAEQVSTEDNKPLPSGLSGLQKRGENITSVLRNFKMRRGLLRIARIVLHFKHILPILEEKL